MTQPSPLSPYTLENDRTKIPEKHKWDLTSLYKSETEWEADFKKVSTESQALLKLKGTLGKSVNNLASTFSLRDLLDRLINKLYTYAHLKSDEDTSNSQRLGQQDRIHTLAIQTQASLAWIEPEILSLSDEILKQYSAADPIQPFKRILDLILRQKPHTLSNNEETLLSLAQEPLSTAEKVFGMINNADMAFPKVKNEKGELIQLTHGNYSTFLESKDRETRKRAFEAIYDTYGSHKNAFAATLSGQVKSHVFFAKVRKHKSALEAALFEDNVSKSVYENLISTVHQHLPIYHRYLAIRKKCLQLSKLDAYDLYVSIIPNFEFKVDYETATQWITKAVAPLGSEYVDSLKRAFTERWIDVLESKGKRSGAYSSGCYDSNPYILMNYTDNLQGAFTLAHELGHSLHSFFSNKNQPHHTSHYKIFVAEVASMTNEVLMSQMLMDSTTDKNFKAFLLNHICDDFKGSIFRQTMFAEYEKTIHEMVEKGEALTVDSLSEKYYALNALYQGPNVEPDKRVALEWSRIPHFYYNFYVYKYATGFSAANAFATKILAGDTRATQLYLSFLKSGSTKDPLDLLADAGVNLRTPEPIREALSIFDKAVSSLEKALSTH